MSEDNNPVRAAYNEKLNQDQWYNRFLKEQRDRHDQEARNKLKNSTPGNNYDQGIYRPKH